MNHIKKYFIISIATFSFCLSLSASISRECFNNNRVEIDGSKKVEAFTALYNHAKKVSDEQRLATIHESKNSTSTNKKSSTSFLSQLSQISESVSNFSFFKSPVAVVEQQPTTKNTQHTHEHTYASTVEEIANIDNQKRSFSKTFIQVESYSLNIIFEHEYNHIFSSKDYIVVVSYNRLYGENCAHEILESFKPTLLSGAVNNINRTVTSVLPGSSKKDTVQSATDAKNIKPSTVQNIKKEPTEENKSSILSSIRSEIKKQGGLF